MRLFRATFSIYARPFHHDSVDWHIYSHLYTIMHKTLIAAILLLVSYSTSFSQQLEFVRIPMSGYTIYRGEEKLKMRELVAHMESNPEAHQLILSSKKLNIVGGLLGTVGGFATGFSLGTAVSGGELNRNLLGIGLGIIAISVPFSIVAGKKAEQAVIVWNNGFQSNSSSRYQPSYYLIGNQQGFGLGIRF